MTAETLKPFITPQSVDNFPATHASRRRQRHTNFLAIGLSLTGAVVGTILLAFTIWNTVRITDLETEVDTLAKVVESMRIRLGINYLEDFKDFEKEYINALIDEPTTLVDSIDADDEDEDDDDDDEDILINDEYDEIDDYDKIDDLMKKFQSYDDDTNEEDSTADSDTSDDDNLYDDFEKFQDSKKNQQSPRKARSIAPVHAPNGLPVYEESYLAQLKKPASSAEASLPVRDQRTSKPTMRPSSYVSFDNFNSKGNHKRHIVAENADNHRRHSPLRQRNHQRRQKIPTMKSGESPLLSAKSTDISNSLAPTPAAAHFHLNRKVPDRHTTFKVDSYEGDMYIGHPSWPNENTIERHFKVDNGVLTVRQPGLYYVYAQVCYNNTHDRNGFVIFHGHKPFLQCLNTVPTNMPLKIHTCHTSGLIQLDVNETIHLRDFHSDHNVILKDTNNRSYFGLMKV